MPGLMALKTASFPAQDRGRTRLPALVGRGETSTRCNAPFVSAVRPNARTGENERDPSARCCELRLTAGSGPIYARNLAGKSQRVSGVSKWTVSQNRLGACQGLAS
jgi:hypothetical protein